MEPEQKHAACTWLARVVPRKQKGRRQSTHSDEHGEQAGHGSINKYSSLRSPWDAFRGTTETAVSQNNDVWVEKRNGFSLLAHISCLPTFASRCSPLFLSCCIYIIPQIWTNLAPAPTHLYLRALTRSVYQTIPESRKQEAEACLVKYRVI